MCSAMLQQVRFTDYEDLSVQCSKSLDMCIDDMKRLRFAAAWESRFLDWKYLHMSIADMHSGQLCDVQELRFETAKSSDMGCATLSEGRFDDAPESSFQGSKIRIWAAKMSISYFSEIAFSGCEMFKYEQEVRFADVQESRFQASRR